VIKDGWVDWAKVIPGVPDKVYSQRNRMEALIGHSIVGSIDAAIGRFLSTEKQGGQYTAAAAASCTFLISYSGELIQMYPIWASPWTSGGYETNTRFVPIEMEGGAYPNYSEPMTDAQVSATMRLAGEFEAYTGKRVVPGTTFREHREAAAQYGYAPTACPSGRYARFYEALAGRPEEDEMSQYAAEVDALKARIEEVNNLRVGLNKAVLQRMDLISLAGGDYTKVQQAHALLVEKGLVERR